MSGPGLRSEACSRVGKGMTRKEVMQGGRPRPHQAALRGHAELSGFYSKSNRESSDLSGGMPGPDFHFEKITLPPMWRTD